MNDIRDAWYSYAKAVAGIDHGHRLECVAATGATGTPALDSNIRWPGYLGSNYESASMKLLCVGQVHHAADLFATLGHVQPLLGALGSGPCDPNIMETITAEYERAMVRWGPWGKFRKILGPLGLDQTSIAYTNVAKCWQTLDPSISPDCRRPMKACSKRFPISQLAKAIHANAIVIMSAESTLAYAGITKGDIPMNSFPGRPSDLQLQRIAESLKSAIEAIKAAS
jgi:hypothetical protein